MLLLWVCGVVCGLPGLWEGVIIYTGVEGESVVGDGSGVIIFILIFSCVFVCMC